MRMSIEVLFKIFVLFFASSTLVAQADCTSEEEAVVVRCNQARQDVRDLWVNDSIDVVPADRKTKESSSLLELLKARDQTRIAATRLKENIDNLDLEIVNCDSACEPVPSIIPSDPGICYAGKDEERLDQMIQQRKEQKADAVETADALDASFKALCSQKPRECLRAAEDSSVKPLSKDELAEFESISKTLKVEKYRKDNGLAAPNPLKESFQAVQEQADKIFDAIQGPTTVQPAPSGVDGVSSARTQARRAPASKPTEKPAEAGAASTSAGTETEAETASAGAPSSVAAASTSTPGSKANGLVATAAILKNQYDAKRESKKQKAANAALRAAALADAAQSESLNAALRIQEGDLKGLTSSRSGDGRTGVGSGGTNVSSSPGSRSLASVSGVTATRASASGGATSGASTSSAPAASAQASLRSSGGGGGSSSGGRSSRPSSGGGSGSDFDKYTQSSGFFAAAKKALGFGSSKKKTEASAERAGRSSTTPGTPEGEPVGATATAAISKHWNKVLRRVEEGPDRGIASVSGNARGTTARNQSIFGSVCNRYSAFRKDMGLKIGRSVCPSAK